MADPVEAAEALAAAVSADLPPGTVLFESIRPEAPPAGDATFFADISQECRTPLTLILGPAADLLTGAHGALSSEQREQISTIYQSGVHLLKLVNTLFTFLRVEAAADETMWPLPDEAFWPISDSARPPDAVQKPPAPPGPAEEARPEGRILIAEDHPEVRNYLDRLLGRQWKTEAVADGRAALAAARARRPDLIIADVMMPELDGLGLLRALRTDLNTSSIPVLLLSGRNGEESRIEGLLAGAADYLVKPFSGRELVAKVRSQIELSRARRRNEELVATQEAFYAAASHELRNPIHSLQLQVIAILRGLEGEEGAPHAEWLRTRIHRANDQLSRVIRLLDKLLDVSRMSSGRLPLELEDVDLAEVVTSVIDRLDTPEQAQIRRALVPTIGRWDRFRLEQVVTNLVTNALKYGEGHPIEVVVRSDEHGARLTVADRGIGVPVEHQQRIFQRFERAVTDRRYAGFGLGLWIVRRVVEELGGTLSLQSAPGEGSTFIVDLPLNSNTRADS